MNDKTTPTPAQADEKALAAARKVYNQTIGEDWKTGATERIIEAYLAALRPEVEPVAEWQARPSDGVGYWCRVDDPQWYRERGYEVRALFASPPAPAVKEAVEALELARRVLTGRADRSLADDLAVQRIDLVLASLLPPEEAQAGSAKESELAEARAEIERLKGLLHANGKTRFNEAVRRLESAEQALMPFADAANGLAPDLPATDQVLLTVGGLPIAWIYTDQLRRARTVLSREATSNE